MPRLAVVGTSCSGKTTLSSRIAHALQIPHVELDGLYWGPNWSAKPDQEFRQAVEAVVASEQWVIDGNYSKVRDIIWPRATHLVWLNYAFMEVFCRAISRTLKRIATKEKLFCDNRETLRLAVFDKDSIPWWVIRTHHRRQREYRKIIEDGLYPYLQILELRRSSDAEDLISRLSNEHRPSTISAPWIAECCENGSADAQHPRPSHRGQV
jgi:adenylate kinase family enzyme